MATEVDRFCLWSGVGAAIALLMGSAFLSATQMVVVSAGLMVGLLVYAWFGLRAPALGRYKLVTAALAAALVGAAVAAGMALLA